MTKTIKTKRIRVGAIGAGGIMIGHLQQLAQRPEVELVAMTDPSTESVARMHQHVPATASLPVFKDYRKMLRKIPLDGVVIGSPHTAHFQQIMDALDLGLHVLAEKPMVCSVAEAKQVVAKARARRRVVTVAYQRRFSGEYRSIREFVRDPGFGRPTFVQAFQSSYWYKCFLTAWRTDPKLSGGGQINDSGSHLVDMLFWIMPSRPVEVTAFMHNRGTRVDVDSAIAFRFADGCLGNMSINGSGPANPGFWEDITIIGENGRAAFMREDAVTLSFGKELMEVKRFRPDGNRTLHWVDVILGKAKNESPPEEFLPTIAFTEACWASAARGGKPTKVRY